MKLGDGAPIELQSWGWSVMTGKAEQPSDDFIVIVFPTQSIRDQYLDGISDRAESEVRLVLANMLGSSRSIPEWDGLQVQIAAAVRSAGIPSSGQVGDSVGSCSEFSDYERRAILAVSGRSDEPTWPGLTWVLDLLPAAPDRALAVLTAFLHADVNVLPDWRITGLSDVAGVIRATSSAGPRDTRRC